MSGNGETGPVYLVLGATGNLGSAVTRRLAASGARVVIAARDTTRLADLSEETRAPALSLNAARFDHVEAALEQTRSNMGRLDGVACCVGTRPIRTDVAEITPADWQEILGADLTAPLATVRAAATVMKRHGGSVVLCSGPAGRLGLPGLEMWSAAKAGVEGLVRAAAAGYARYELRFNCVAPGPLVEAGAENCDPEMADAVASALPLPALGRQGRADEAAAAVVWLLAREQGWVTGQVFRVDGGLSCCHG